MPYAGDISCSDCWEALKSDATAQLVDVRTSAEWNFVGFTDLSAAGKKPIMTEWQTYPLMQINPDFVFQTTEAIRAAGADQSSRIFTLCRSGVRSIAAAEALTDAGFSDVYNILAGFEGNPDESGHRGNVAGWKHDGLPWLQK